MQHSSERKLGPVRASLPLCRPYSERKGEWALDVPWDSGPAEPHQYWVASAEDEQEPCRYLVSSETDFVACFQDRRIMLVGDSTARNLVMQLADFLGQCGSGQSAQRLGPDDPLAIRMCSQTYAALRAHGDVSVVTPPSLGNVTLDFRWAPYLADVSRVAREQLGTPAAQGGPDAAVITLGYWTAKDAASAGGLDSAPVRDFVEELPRLASLLREELAPRNPALLAGHLTYAFAPYAEGREANGGNHPRDVVDALNAAAATTLGAAGLPVFDGRWFTRVSPEALASSNGKIVTWDGYHPAHAVVLTLMREHLSHFCALPSWGGQQPAAAAAAAAPAAAGAAQGHLLGGLGARTPSCSSLGALDIYALPLLIILLGTLGVCALFHCTSDRPAQVPAERGEGREGK